MMHPALEEIAGQVAIVTGATRGLGRDIAIALANAGAAVGVVARSASECDELAGEIAAAGQRALALPGDVRSGDDIDRVVEASELELGPTSLLVNNAGTAGPVGPDWLVDGEEWWQCIAVSVKGSFLCSQAVLPGMIERDRGRIVNIVSTSGTRPRPHLSGTSVANTAQIRLTEGLSVALKPTGVLAFAVHPGAVRTELTDRYLAAADTWLPEYRDPAPGFWSPSSCVVDVVKTIATGALDPLSGRFLDATRGVDALLDETSHPGLAERLTLRLIP